MSEIVIIGAGLAGLIAAHRFPSAKIIEAAPEKALRGGTHKALLRFRSGDVGTLTGIPFKKVTVHKNIVDDNDNIHDKCNIQLANIYSNLVTGTIRDRSIWNLDQCERYIAPDYFYDRMLDKVIAEGRIQFETSIETLDPNVKYINTAPMAVMLKLCKMVVPELLRESSAIHVTRVNLPYDVDVYQTLYFPSQSHSTYRASLTGQSLIIEHVMDNHNKAMVPRKTISVMELFGLPIKGMEDAKIEGFTQKMGKIVDLPKEQRTAILYRLTQEFNVYSVGRFATHRNILLDDVVHDLDVVSKLIDASEYYRSVLINAK